MANLAFHQETVTLLRSILERRSIRRFTKRPVSEKLLKLIVRAGQRAPTSCGAQFYSFIEIKDLKKRRAIIALLGKNQTLESASVWIFICCDVARPLKLFEALNTDCYLGEVTGLLHSVIDASLAAQNMVVAAENLGLGSVFTIYHWKALTEISKLLNLPSRTLPLLLLCIGYPDEKPPLRPRWKIDIVLHSNRYIPPTVKTMLSDYRRANQILVNMKYFRRDVGSLSENWERKFASREMILREKKLRMEMQKLGFLPKRL